METKYSIYKQNYELLVEKISQDFNLTINLSYDVCDEYYPYLKLIFIDKKQNWRGRYYSLLHELGHHIIFSNSSYRENYYPGFKKFFGSNYSKAEYVCLVNEELEAWKFGKMYAESNNLKIDRFYFGQITVDNVMTHMLSGIKKLYF
tara:strand:+ start:166 stop:606 length:441 start_codon:yes stop_codon:yes gene_type:complete